MFMNMCTASLFSLMSNNIDVDIFFLQKEIAKAREKSTVSSTSTRAEQTIDEKADKNASDSDDSDDDDDEDDDVVGPLPPKDFKSAEQSSIKYAL